MSKKIVILDLCDTLVKGNTTFLFLDSYFRDVPSYQFYMKCKKNLVLRAFFKLLRKLSYDLNRRIAVKFLKGTARTDLYNYAKLMVEKDFEFNHDIIKIVKYCQQQKIEIMILSASLDFIVEAVANNLNINWKGSELSYNNSACSGEIKNDLLFSKHKFIENLKCNIDTDVFFISDNVEDAKIIKSLNNGFGYYTLKNKSAFESNNIRKFSTVEIISKLEVSNEMLGEG